MTPEQFVRWIETERGGNIALSLLIVLWASISGMTGYLVGRRRRING